MYLWSSRCDDAVALRRGEEEFDDEGILVRGMGNSDARLGLNPPPPPLDFPGCWELPVVFFFSISCS